MLGTVLGLLAATIAALLVKPLQLSWRRGAGLIGTAVGLFLLSLVVEGVSLHSEEFDDRKTLALIGTYACAVAWLLLFLGALGLSGLLGSDDHEESGTLDPPLAELTSDGADAGDPEDATS